MGRQLSTDAKPAKSANGVQSVQRTLDILEIVAAAGGHLSIVDIAAQTSIPLPTIHRLLGTLTDRGYIRRLPNREYALGFRLVPLGAAATALVGPDTHTVLAGLVADLGETANLAIISGDYAQYVAQVPSAHTMRTFTEVGRKVEMHCTGVGKALLAQLDDDQVRHVAARIGLPAYTDHTLTTEDALLNALANIRDRGWAEDAQEQEIGVRCVAVPVTSHGRSWMAVSVSGPVTRMTDALVERAIPLLHSAAIRLNAETS